MNIGRESERMKDPPVFCSHQRWFLWELKNKLPSGKHWRGMVNGVEAVGITGETGRGGKVFSSSEFSCLVLSW